MKGVVPSVVPGVVPAVATIAALLGAALVRRQAPWVSWLYLLALIGLAAAVWHLARPGERSPVNRVPRRGRLAGVGAGALLIVALTPVPWMTAALDDPPGTAWRLDGRLQVAGERYDPPGDWYWLTVGRPPLVAEVVRGWLPGAPAAVSLRTSSASNSPRLNEPAAVAVGLRAAGLPVELRLIVELSSPTDPDRPDRIIVTHVDDRPVTTTADWERLIDGLAAGGSFTLTGADGTTQRVVGPDLPYRRVELLEVPDAELDAFIGGTLASTPVGRWFRGLALGRSHGLMVALVTYAHVSGEDLARGRSIAGTGGIRGDGTVTRIGGLTSKARAAAAIGADVLLVPAEQAHLLEGLDLGATIVVPVSHLDDAVSALRG